MFKTIPQIPTVIYQNLAGTAQTRGNGQKAQNSLLGPGYDSFAQILVMILVSKLSVYLFCVHRMQNTGMNHFL
jgi:hypothetical protein